MLDDVDAYAPSGRKLDLVECVVDSGVAFPLRQFIPRRGEGRYLHYGKRLPLSILHLKVRLSSWVAAGWVT